MEPDPFEQILVTGLYAEVERDDGTSRPKPVVGYGVLPNGERRALTLGEHGELVPLDRVRFYHWQPRGH